MLVQINVEEGRNVCKFSYCTTGHKYFVNSYIIFNSLNRLFLTGWQKKVPNQWLIQGVGDWVDWVASHPPWVCSLHNIFYLSTLIYLNKPFL